MWKPFRKRFAGLFGFDRRERRGTYVLAMMLVVLLLCQGFFTLRPDSEHLNDELIAPARPADLTARQDEAVQQLLFTLIPTLHRSLTL